MSWERNHRGAELSLVVGPWNKEPAARGDSPQAGVPEGEQSWQEWGSCKKQDYQRPLEEEAGKPLDKG